MTDDERYQEWANAAANIPDPVESRIKTDGARVIAFLGKLGIKRTEITADMLADVYEFLSESIRGSE